MKYFEKILIFFNKKVTFRKNNILIKSKPEAFVDGVKGVLVHPVIIRITN